MAEIILIDDREFRTPVYTEENTRALGGPDSGNFGHSGRPGEVGGSSSEGEKPTYEQITQSVRGFLKDVDVKHEHISSNEIWEYVDTPKGKAGLALKDLYRNDRPEIEIHWLTAMKRGSGRAALEHVMQMADKHGVTLSLWALPLAGAGENEGFSLSPRRLEKFYREFGFKKDRTEDGVSHMTRVPKKLRSAGGPGSGNFGHAGRPGEVGGSGEGGGHLITDKKLNPEIEKTVMGGTGRTLAIAKDIAHTLNVPTKIYLRSGLTDEGGQKVTIAIIGQEDNELQIHNTYFVDDDGMTEVYHEYITFPESMQGGGLGKRVLETELNHYESIGASRVKLLANIDVGSYAWAKFGYQLDPDDEANHAQAFAFALKNHMDEGGVPATTQKRVMQLIDDHTADDLETLDPKVIWKIADLRDDNDRKIGADALMDFQWHGVLDLHNPEAMARARTYIAKR